MTIIKCLMNFAMSASLVKVVFVKLRGGVKHSYSCAHYYVLPLSFHLQVWMLRFLTKCSDTQLHCLVCKSVQNMHCQLQPGASSVLANWDRKETRRYLPLSA